MPEKQRALKINPQLLNTVLTPHPLVVENLPLTEGARFIDPDHLYDAELLNDRLASIPLEGIDTNDLRSIPEQVLTRQKELAFGGGLEGNVREVLTSASNQATPFASRLARFDNPGTIWLLTRATGEFIDTETGIQPTVDEYINGYKTFRNQKRTQQTAYGLVPLEEAMRNIESEVQRRLLCPDIKPTYEVEQVLILPEVISEYTKKLRSYGRRNPGNIDVPTFRQQYFNMPEGANKPTDVLKKIKAEYLGDTTWGTILTAELLIRAADYAIGHIPVAGPVWDFLQASTGKEFPLPLMERAIRRSLRDANLPLPEGVFDKPGKGRWLEVVDMVIGAIPHFFPPAVLAKIPLGTILEAAIYADKMKNSAKYFKPFLEIAESTGTKPQVIDKVQQISKMPGAVIKNALQRKRKQQ